MECNGIIQTFASAHCIFASTFRLFFSKSFHSFLEVQAQYCFGSAVRTSGGPSTNNNTYVTEQQHNKQGDTALLCSHLRGWVFGYV